MDAGVPVSSTIHVLATSIDATSAALETAVPLAKGAGARLVILVAQIVPYAVDLDRPVDSSAFAVRRYRERVVDLGGEASVRLCLCRRIEDIIVQLLPAHATVVVGGRDDGWLPTRDRRLVQRIAQLGHRAIFTPVRPSLTGPGTRAATAIFLVLFALMARTAAQQAPGPAPEWQYGGFVDTAVLVDANTPSNHLFRNRGTTPRVDELDLNMAAAYARKPATPSSPFGFEATVQGGEDSATFGFSATAPNIGGADVLRHLGPTDVSYLAPVGRGLTIQGGIFSSLIGYDSLYAKDNFNYTRPWGADYTPYLMLGVNVAYPIAPSLTVTGFVVNGYWHLAHANDVPSWGGQVAWKASDGVTVKETALVGPHQADTSLRYWRGLSDTIVEWKNRRMTVAGEQQVASERVVAPGDPRALWMAAQLPIHWNVAGPWSVAVRPEYAWDRDGRWTGFPQSVKAITTTAEYRVPYKRTGAIVRAEYRYDDSRGRGGGFFSSSGGTGRSDTLVPTQSLFVVGVILTFDATR